ncbi:MAG: polysaccharide biosynthesis/export family protein [Myxococcaceae bacterium]|jgi:protein involved in polysaccharide export with SLBB domain|nr:polysaccharide biosynthesis/export family protein [Myxococcaceae bacterium]MCA3013841.1 polysaccharide biosynthesis/export family protein [Myxococcaceae bacterium]
MRLISALALVVITLLVSACKTPRPLGGQVRADDVALPDGGVGSNTLGTGDFLEVRTYQEPDLSGVFRVSPEGVIDFPLCGKVRVASLTPSLAADAISGCLRQGYVRRPQVTVMVKEFSSKRIFVFGDVAKPASFPYEEGMTIVSAVSAAGGFNRTAARNGVNVTRLIEGKETRVPVRVDDIINGTQRNFTLLPGDIVFVPEAIF